MQNSSPRRRIRRTTSPTLYLSHCPRCLHRDTTTVLRIASELWQILNKHVSVILHDILCRNCQSLWTVSVISSESKSHSVFYLETRGLTYLDLYTLDVSTDYITITEHRILQRI